MRGGHNKKSTRELKENGTYQATYHANRLETVIKTEKRISPPPNLPPRVLAKWTWVCDKIAANDMLTDADRDAILIYAENWVLYEDCADDVRKNGTYLWIETSAGKKPITNPAFRHMKDCETIVKQIWDQFGFTPRARMGLKVAEKPPEAGDPLDFLN